ncbi:MAG: hypothetical protein AAF989_10890, partial [Planctomycetota bacterium]
AFEVGCVPMNDRDPVGGAAAANAQNLPPGECLFCHRITRKGTTKHHLIPRRCHHNKWFKKRFKRLEMQQTIPLCRDCHAAVHRFVPREKDLGRYYRTTESLLAHDDIRRFVAWVKNRK